MSENSKDDLLNLAINEDISIVPYNSLWTSKFIEEKARLLGIFSDDIVEIEHIGSTAVVGLAAKPIIDMMGSVLSMKAADYLLGPLREFGYVTPIDCNIDLAERRWLMRYSNGHRTHHLHLVRINSAGWKRTIKFRDILQTQLEVAKQYEQLKTTLAKDNVNNRNAYIQGKSAFIEEVLKRFN
jgi:GrpB-like predicted nucleotidyltransferase (UPF0157 family)